MGRLCSDLNDEYRELLSPEVRERAYKATVANSKERVVKYFKLRINRGGMWTLEKMVNPIDDPKGYRAKYPATDDPQGQDRGQAMEVELITDPSMETTPSTSVAPEMTATSAGSKTFSEAADKFLSTMRAATPEAGRQPEDAPKKVSPERKKHPTPPRSDTSPDKTDSSKEDWPPETAAERYRRELKQLDYEKKQREKTLKKMLQKEEKKEKSKSRSRSKTPRKEGTASSEKKGRHSEKKNRSDKKKTTGTGSDKPSTSAGQPLPEQRPQAANPEPPRRVLNLIRAEVRDTRSRQGQKDINFFFNL